MQVQTEANQSFTHENLRGQWQGDIILMDGVSGIAPLWEEVVRGQNMYRFMGICSDSADWKEEDYKTGDRFEKEAYRQVYQTQSATIFVLNDHSRNGQ